MSAKKKVVLKVGLIGLVIILVITGVIVTNNFQNNKSNKDKVELKTSEKQKENKEDLEDENSNTSMDSSNTNQSDSVQEEQSQISSISSSSQTTTPKQETPQVQSPPVAKSETQTTTCTSKKFYSVFRADFDSLEKCNSKGYELKSSKGYYGFFCDYQTDDCGTTYYMLTMFDSNGNQYGYDTIK